MVQIAIRWFAKCITFWLIHQGKRVILTETPSPPHIFGDIFTLLPLTSDESPREGLFLNYMNLIGMIFTLAQDTDKSVHHTDTYFDNQLVKKYLDNQIERNIGGI